MSGLEKSATSQMRTIYRDGFHPDRMDQTHHAVEVLRIAGSNSWCEGPIHPDFSHMLDRAIPLAVECVDYHNASAPALRAVAFKFIERGEPMPLALSKYIGQVVREYVAAGDEPKVAMGKAIGSGRKGRRAADDTFALAAALSFVMATGKTLHGAAKWLKDGGTINGVTIKGFHIGSGAIEKRVNAHWECLSHLERAVLADRPKGHPTSAKEDFAGLFEQDPD